MIVKPLLVLLGAQLLIPASDQVPSLGVAASCKAVTAMGIVDSQSYEACMKDENSARVQLVQSWQSFSAPHRVQCTSEASMGGTASYVDLLVCLQLARDAAAAQKIELKGAGRRR